MNDKFYQMIDYLANESRKHTVVKKMSGDIASSVTNESQVLELIKLFDHGDAEVNKCVLSVLDLLGPLACCAKTSLEAKVESLEPENRELAKRIIQEC